MVYMTWHAKIASFTKSAMTALKPSTKAIVFIYFTKINKKCLYMGLTVTDEKVILNCLKNTIKIHVHTKLL